MKAALFVGGGKEGHAPTDFADSYRTLLEVKGFAVDVYEPLEALKRPKDLADVELITPIWSLARSEHQE